MDPQAVERIRTGLRARPPGKVVLFADGKLGDAVCLTAVARWVRTLWPRCRLVVVTRPVADEVFLACPHVDEVWLGPISGSTHRLSVGSRAQ